MPLFCGDIHVFSHRTHKTMNMSVLSSDKSVFAVPHGKPYKEGSSIRRRLIGDYSPNGSQGADNCTVTAHVAMGGTSGRLRSGPVLIGHFSPLSANEESPEAYDTFPVKSCYKSWTCRDDSDERRSSKLWSLAFNQRGRKLGQFCYLNICYFWMRIVKKKTL